MKALFTDMFTIESDEDFTLDEVQSAIAKWWQDWQRGEKPNAAVELSRRGVGGGDTTGDTKVTVIVRQVNLSNRIEMPQEEFI